MFFTFKKAPKNKRNKLFASYSAFLFFLVIYIVQYTYIDIIKYEENFLYNKEVKAEKINVKTTKITEYQKCLIENNSCDLKILWQNDLDVIHNLLNSLITVHSLNKIDSELIKLVEKKELIE